MNGNCRIIRNEDQFNCKLLVWTYYSLFSFLIEEKMTKLSRKLFGLQETARLNLFVGLVERKMID